LTGYILYFINTFASIRLVDIKFDFDFVFIDFNIKIIYMQFLQGKSDDKFEIFESTEIFFGADLDFIIV